ncbi:glycosyltransferase family 4 protein [Psychrobacter sp. I-STPA10]|uniref:glycosyltransferase family 4 protein n=1 Tax=Psychrobacter sp. I-STPA10 TaxID=2585769 RepID=UPI001E3196A2|nr:glycosyltransferase family 1 protein [Psychrobacter sp. I-STPA10]
MTVDTFNSITRAAMQHDNNNFFNDSNDNNNSNSNNNGNNNDNNNSANIYKHQQAKPLHIVLVTETWQPDVNGVAMSLYQLVSEMVKMGHQVSLVSPSKSLVEAKKEREVASLQPSIVSHHILVKGIPIPRYSDLQFGMPAYKQLKKQFASIRPDIVHIATEGPLGLAALCAAKRLKIPATTGYHTQFHDFSRHFGLGILAHPIMAYFKRFHNWSAATCVPSQKTQNDLQQLGFKRLVQVGRGVDTKHYHPQMRSQALRDSWQVQQQHTVLMMVSRLSPEKGVDLVIQAFKALQSTQLHRAMKLVIVGDGPDRQRLQALAQQCSDDIIFAGMQTGTALAAHYASADAFVFASQVETFGNVVTEAMASGLPIFAFDDAAAGMFVDAHCGQLADMGDTQGFIDMVARLPKACQLQKMGIQARHRVASHSWQRPAVQMLEMFVAAIPDTKMANRKTPEADILQAMQANKIKQGNMLLIEHSKAQCQPTNVPLTDKASLL